MWRYEQRTPVLSQPELELGDQASNGPMDQRFAASRAILDYDPINWSMLRRCEKCGDPYPCHIKYCRKCFDRPIDPDAWRVDPGRFISADVVNPVCYPHWVGKGAFRHLESAYRMIEPFFGLPVQDVAPFTIKYCVFQGGEDHVSAKHFYAGWMWEIANAYSRYVQSGVIMTYRFEWSFTTAGQVKWGLPFRAPGLTDVADMDPDQVVALFHCHGFGYFPGLDNSNVGDIFRMVFDGAWQVMISTPRPDTVVPTGRSPTLELASADVPLFAQPTHEEPEDDIDDPDHDDGYVDVLSDRPIREDYDRSIDEELDALSEHLYLEVADTNECHDGEPEEWKSGLIKYANYAYKEHLPKARSRYSGYGAKPHPGSATGGLPSGQGKPLPNGDDDPDLVLTPEQMVIAIHADAELKRAFYRKQLTHSYGVIARATKPPVVLSPIVIVGTANPYNCYSINQATNTGAGNSDHKFNDVKIPIINFDVPLCPSSYLPVRTNQAELLVIRTWPNIITDSYIIKEDQQRVVETALFFSDSTEPMKTMRLGQRVLRPP